MLSRTYRLKFYLNARHWGKVGSEDCKPHPHTWELVLYMEKRNNTMMDFTKTEGEIQKFLSTYEGGSLNHIPPFNVIPSELENIGEFFYWSLLKITGESRVKLCRLEISETPLKTYIIDSKRGPPASDSPGNIENYPRDILNLEIASVDESAVSIEVSGGMDQIQPERPDLIAQVAGTGKSLLLCCRKQKHWSFFRKKTVIFLFYLSMLAVFSVLLYLWMTRKGAYPWASDTWGHLFKSHLLYKEVKQGNLFPLYTGLWYNGIQPFRYWAPLPYYLLMGLEFIAKGQIILAYNLFAIAAFALGAAAWFLWGEAVGRRWVGAAAALLWFFLPDNLRVMFSEGNIPRVLVSTIFPYLLLGMWMYMDNGKGKGLTAVILCMLLITLTHAMIAAMVGITLFFYVLLNIFITKDGYRRSLALLGGVAAGIMLAGIWLYPALKGGIMSLDQDAVNEVMKGLTYPIAQSLNPLLRLQNVEIFYFGFSILVISLLGVFFGNSKSKAAFGITVMIFLGTTKMLLFLFQKLPMSQLFWMMRFTPMAMGMFFVGLLMWRNVRKEVLVSVLVLLMLDCSISVKVLCYDVPYPENLRNMIAPAVESAVQRLAVLDASEFGSYPSYSISFNEDGESRKPQVFGWAWQGAATSSNIVWLNTGLEKEWYAFMFDRALELGADTLVIKKDKIKDRDYLLQEASRIGYVQKSETPLGIVLQYPVNGEFGSKVHYEGLAIGKYAVNMALCFPLFEVGNSPYIDDYDENTLIRYKSIFLSGFKARDRTKAEEMVKRLSNRGTRFIIDLTGMENRMGSEKAEFLGVKAQPVTFINTLPGLKTEGSNIEPLAAILTETKKWSTFYLEGLDRTLGTADFQDREISFLGTAINDHIYFIGLNIPFLAVQSKHPGIIKILERITGLQRDQLPAREIVKINVTVSHNRIHIEAPEGDVLTGVAYLDAFRATEGETVQLHNLISVKKRKTTLVACYPYLKEGCLISFLGFLAAFKLRISQPL